MMTKHYYAIIILSLLGFVQAKGQDCDDLIKKHNILSKAKKVQEVQKIEELLDEKDCPKWSTVKVHANSARKKADKTNVFALGEDSVFIGYEGSQHAVTVSGGGFWKANVDCEWCKITKEYDRIIIICDENPNIQERVAKVTVTKGKRKKTIVVTNGGAPEFLISSVKKLSFPSEGDQIEVNINSNTQWQVDIVPKWVSAKRDGNRMLFSTEMNKGFHKQSGYVFITSSHERISIEVNQSARNEKSAFSKDSLYFSPHGGEEFVKVYFDEDDWEIKDGPTWCNLKKIGRDTIWIRTGDNDRIDQVRMGSIKVMKGDQAFFINISQEANPIVYEVIPEFGIRGRDLSFGFSLGYIHPVVSASSGGNFTGSAVNYVLGNDAETPSYSSSGGINISLFADKRIYKNFYLKAGLEFTHYSYKNTFGNDVERKIQNTSTKYYIRGIAHNSYEEDYTINQLDIPILASYRFSTGIISHIQLNVGPTIHYGLSAKLKLSGNTDIDNPKTYKYENQQFTDDPYPGLLPAPIHYTLNGEVDLYDTNGNYAETYTTGNNNTINVPRTLDDAPLKRFGWGIRFGAAYEYAGVSLALEYNMMLSNLANNNFWKGDRWKVFGGETPNLVMSGYKQRNSYLGVKLAYTFRY